MPIEVGIWRIDGTPQRIHFSTIENESKLESVLNSDIGILDPDLMIVGRQVPTAFGKFIDLLAIDAEGSLTVIELKRDRTPREVVAQVLDYASWIETLTYEDITKSCVHHESYSVHRSSLLIVYTTSPGCRSRAPATQMACLRSWGVGCRHTPLYCLDRHR